MKNFALAHRLRRFAHMPLVVWLLVPVACSSSSSSPSDPVDGGGTGDGGGDPGACRHVADACSGSCADGLKCEDLRDKKLCMSYHGTCGGFVGAQCKADAPNCMRVDGGEHGFCMTDDEKSCTCARTPESFYDCRTK